MRFVDRARVRSRRVYFVLGNHDYYRSSIAAVRGARRAPADRDRRGCPGTIRSSSRRTRRCSASTAGATRAAATSRRRSSSPTGQLIDDFKRGNRRRSRLCSGSARNEARALREHLAAAPDSEHLLVLTHVPPFRRGLRLRRRAVSTPAWLPWFTCIATGEVLLEHARAHPDQQITVLCGHSHGLGSFQAAAEPRRAHRRLAEGRQGLRQPGRRRRRSTSSRSAYVRARPASRDRHSRARVSDSSPSRRRGRPASAGSRAYRSRRPSTSTHDSCRQAHARPKSSRRPSASLEIEAQRRVELGGRRPTTDRRSTADRRDAAGTRGGAPRRPRASAMNRRRTARSPMRRAAGVIVECASRATRLLAGRLGAALARSALLESACRRSADSRQRPRGQSCGGDAVIPLRCHAGRTAAPVTAARHARPPAFPCSMRTTTNPPESGVRSARPPRVRTAWHACQCLTRSRRR